VGEARREREYLNKGLAKDMMNKVNSFFESMIEMLRARHGKARAHQLYCLFENSRKN
jgi:hypothetical protein